VNPWLRFTQLADLFESAAVLFEFLAGFAEFALRGEALVIVELLDRAVDQLL
jgi:hypothetical protein